MGTDEIMSPKETLNLVKAINEEGLNMKMMVKKDLRGCVGLCYILST